MSKTDIPPCAGGPDDTSGPDDFMELYARIAGYWPEDWEERNRIFWGSPGVLPSILAGAYQLGGALSRVEAKDLDNMFASLLRVQLLAHAGDETAKQQVLAVKKLLAPATYQVPLKIIEDLAKKYNAVGPLARGWELRRLMAELAEIVVPANPQNTCVLCGPVRVSEAPPARGTPLYQEALERCRKRTTLQSLAISIYLDRLQKEGDFKTDERSLRRDLDKVRRWEETDRRHMEFINRPYASRRTPVTFLLPTVKLSESELPLPESDPV